MDDEALLNALGKRIREQSGEPTRELAEMLSRLNAGQLSQAQIASLRSQLTESESQKRVFEAMQPLGERFRSDLQKKLHKQIRQEKTSKWAWLWQWQSLTVATSVVGVVLLVLFWFVAHRHRLPEYEISVTGVVKQVRNGDHLVAEATDSMYTFKRGAQATFILRPIKAVTEPVKAVVFLQQADHWQRLHLPAQVDPRGSVRIVATVGRELDLPHGEYALWIGVVHDSTEVPRNPKNFDWLSSWPGFRAHIRLISP